MAQKRIQWVQTSYLGNIFVKHLEQILPCEFQDPCLFASVTQNLYAIVFLKKLSIYPIVLIDIPNIAKLYLYGMLGITIFLAPANAQSDVGPSTSDLVLLFSIAILCVVGIILYMTRDILLRKKTNYDQGEFESQKNRDYEKYHSDWGDETVKEDPSKHNADLTEMADAGDLPDYYQTLGLDKTATQKEIKSQYRKLAKELHPDKTKKDSQKEMTKLNKAYEILSDEKTKSQYDKLLD